MSKIYQGAWATIVALDAESGHSGIPRVRPNPTLLQKQVSFRLGSTTLFSVLPTLAQQAAETKWQSRAWTYQEAIMSPGVYSSAKIKCTLSETLSSIARASMTKTPLLS